MNSIKMLVRDHGDMTFRAALGRAKCARCGKRLVAAYLCAGHNREWCNGAPPCWAVQIISADGYVF